MLECLGISDVFHDMRADLRPRGRFIRALGGYKLKFDLLICFEDQPRSPCNPFILMDPCDWCGELIRGTYLPGIPFAVLDIRNALFGRVQNTHVPGNESKMSVSRILRRSKRGLLFLPQKRAYAA